jgi:hypothetical protein
MRHVYRRALFALVVMLLSFSAFADELSNDPQAKIRPPVGAQTSQEEPTIPAPDGDPQAKIGPPVGIQAGQQEPNIPAPDGVATQTLFDAFRIWLSLQRILSTVG